VAILPDGHAPLTAAAIVLIVTHLAIVAPPHMLAVPAASASAGFPPLAHADACAVVSGHTFTLVADSATQDNTALATGAAVPLTLHFLASVPVFPWGMLGLRHSGIFAASHAAEAVFPANGVFGSPHRRVWVDVSHFRKVVSTSPAEQSATQLSGHASRDATSVPHILGLLVMEAFSLVKVEIWPSLLADSVLAVSLSLCAVVLAAFSLTAATPAPTAAREAAPATVVVSGAATKAWVRAAVIPAAPANACRS